jgi:ABC-type bacteriocin/lantibiotic exporter with double-glycine peptidase domain
MRDNEIEGFLALIVMLQFLILMRLTNEPLLIIPFIIFSVLAVIYSVESWISFVQWLRKRKCKRENIGEV